MGTAFVWGLIWVLDRRMGGTIERLTVILKGFGPECQVAVKGFKEKLEAAGVVVGEPGPVGLEGRGPHEADADLVREKRRDEHVEEVGLEAGDEDAPRLLGAVLLIVIVTGTLVSTPEAKQPFELRADRIELEGACPPEYPLQPKRHSVEFLRTLPHLRPRTNLFSAVFRRPAQERAICWNNSR